MYHNIHIMNLLINISQLNNILQHIYIYDIITSIFIIQYEEQNEDTMKGSVGFKLYWTYFTNGTRVIGLFLFFFCFTILHLSQFFSDWFLAEWLVILFVRGLFCLLWLICYFLFSNNITNILIHITNIIYQKSMYIILHTIFNFIQSCSINNRRSAGLEKNIGLNDTTEYIRLTYGYNLNDYIYIFFINLLFLTLIGKHIYQLIIIYTYI